MDGQLDDGKADQQPPLHPLRRVFIPIERKTSAGTSVFRTTDNEMYCRADDGSIRSVNKKMNGKKARKLRRRGHA